MRTGLFISSFFKNRQPRFKMREPLFIRQKLSLYMQTKFLTKTLKPTVVRKIPDEMSRFGVAVALVRTEWSLNWCSVTRPFKRMWYAPYKRFALLLVPYNTPDNHPIGCKLADNFSQCVNSLKVRLGLSFSRKSTVIKAGVAPDLEQHLFQLGCLSWPGAELNEC